MIYELASPEELAHEIGRNTRLARAARGLRQEDLPSSAAVRAQGDWCVRFVGSAMPTDSSAKASSKASALGAFFRRR